MTIWGVSEILGRAVVPFIREREREENSNRVKAIARAALAKSGDKKLIELLLSSRDYIMRASIANYLADNPPRDADRIMAANYVRAALANETTRAVAEALDKALKQMKQ